jgi:chromosome segregation ATPase
VIGEAPKAVQEPADPGEAKARRELARMTTDALIDEVIGLRAALAEERAKRRDMVAKVDDLKAQIAVFEDGHDMGAKLGRALDEITRTKGRMKEIQVQLARETRRANAMQKARDDLQARLEAQVIPMDGMA